MESSVNDPLIKGVVRESIRQWKADIEHEDSTAVTLKNYSKYIRRKWIFIGLCLAATIFVSGFSLSVGEYDIGFWETYQILIDNIFGNPEWTLKGFIVMELRLPRLLTAILAGVGLAVAGVAMQSTLLNPLADPYTTGVSSGAMFGATLAMILGISVIGGAKYGMVVNAFIFSLIPMFVIISVSKLKSASVTTIIMAGIAVMYLFNAVTSLMKIWAENAALAAVFEWSVGDLTGLKWEEVVVMAIVVIPGTIILYLMAEKLNAMTMGDEQAKTLGINVERFRIASLLVTSLVTAAVVCFTGLIGFIGLVCPHIVRMFIGSDNRLLLPASAAFGAAFLIVCDVLGRVILAPTTLQVGIITAFIGGPMFLYLIIKQRRTGW